MYECMIMWTTIAHLVVECWYEYAYRYVLAGDAHHSGWSEGTTKFIFIHSIQFCCFILLYLYRYFAFTIYTSLYISKKLAKRVDCLPPVLYLNNQFPWSSIIHDNMSDVWAGSVVYIWAYLRWYVGYISQMFDYNMNWRKPCLRTQYVFANTSTNIIYIYS